MSRFFTLTRFYSRSQGNTTFNFYVKNKQLIAEAVRDGETRQLPISNNIPRDFQINLDKERIKKFQTMFDQCYFGVQGDKILVNARGLGGWNPDVHSGYNFSNNTLRYTEYGTYRLAREVGFSRAHARIIADACQAVDDELATGPYPLQGDQRRHFDTYSNTWENWASENDPRMQYAIANFNFAIERREENNERAALRALGTGLHSLQDMFSHTPDFTELLIGIAAQGHGADDVTERPRTRIRYMIEATRLYLRAYRNNEQLEEHFLPRIQEFIGNPPRKSAFAKIVTFGLAGVGALIGAIPGTFFGGPLLGSAGGGAVGGVVGGAVGAAVANLEPDIDPVSTAFRVER